MNDWQQLVVNKLDSLEGKIDRLDDHMKSELEPIKVHVTKVRLVTYILAGLLTTASGLAATLI